MRIRHRRNYTLLLFIVVFSIGSSAALLASERQSSKTLSAIEQYESGNEAAAIRILIQLGYQGDVAAQFNLGIINLSRDDQISGRREALFWFRKAAEEGDVGAQFNLAMLQHDAEDPALQEESLVWLQRAAEAGRVEAQTNLGILLHTSDTAAAANQRSARQWLEFAAAADDAAAKQALPQLAIPGTDALLERLLYPLDLVLRAETLRSGSEVLTDQARIYPLPARGQKPLTAVAKGTMVEVTEKRDGWVKVKLERGLPAWIQSKLVEVIGEEAIVRRLEGPLYVEPEIGPEVVKLGTATKGEALFILQSDADWLQVEAPKRFSGWVRETDIDIRVRTVASSHDPVVPRTTSAAPAAAVPAAAVSVTPGVSIPGDSAEPGFGHTLRRLPLNPRPGTGLFRLADRTEVLVDPVPGARPLGLIDHDTIVEVTKQLDGFSYSETLPLVGWSFAGLIDITRQPDVGARGAGTANRTGGRVRIEPAIGTTIVDRLTRGDAVSILDSRDGWMLIEVGPKAGWIADTMLRRIQSADMDTFVAVDEATVVDGEASRIAQAPEGAGNLVAAGQGAATGSTITIEQDAIVFAGPLLTSAPLGRLTVPGKVTRPTQGGSGKSVNMALIQRAEKLSGWVFGSLVENGEGGGETAFGTVSVNNARVRLDPTTGRDNIITLLKRGTEVEIAGREGDWLRILLPASAGYVVVSK